MPWVGADGNVQAQRTIFRLSIFSDIFWGFINIIGLFFGTLVDPKKSYKKQDFPVSRSGGSSSGTGGGGAGGAGGGARRPNIRGMDAVRACTPRG